MRLEEIGGLKAKVVSYTTNKTEHTHEEDREMYLPMEVDHVGGSEPVEEDSKRVNVLHLWNDGTLRMILYKERQGQGERRRRRQGMRQRKKGKSMKGTGRN